MPYVIVILLLHNPHDLVISVSIHMPFVVMYVYSSGSHIAKSNSSHIAKISPIHCGVRPGLVFFG